MKIAYNKKRLRANLYFSLVWLVLGILQIVLLRDQPWLGLGWICLSIVYFAIFIYNKSNHYVTITSECIKQNWPFGKKIQIAEVLDVKYFSEDYIIKTNTDELRINTNLIDDESLNDLQSILSNLNPDKE